MNYIIWLLFGTLPLITLSTICLGEVQGIDSADSITFITEKNGFIGGTDKIWRTTDGGYNWTIVYQQKKKKGEEDFFHHITMVNQKVGYTIGFSAILKTNDGGKTWNLIFSPKNKNEKFSPTEPSFSSENRIYIAGGDLIHTSLDGGNSWRKIRWPIPKNYVVSITVVGNNLLAGTGKGYIYKSTDNGVKWEKVGKNKSAGEKVNDKIISFPEEIGPWVIHTLKIFPSGIGYSVNFVGGVSKTEDGGNTWRMVRHPVPTPPLDELIKLPDPFIETFHWSALVFDENRVFIPSDGGELLYTHDGGKSWHRAKVTLLDGKKSAEDLKSVSMIDANRGWMIGSTGELYKTEDGGKTWKQQSYRAVK